MIKIKEIVLRDELIKGYSKERTLNDNVIEYESMKEYYNKRKEELEEFVKEYDNQKINRDYKIFYADDNIFYAEKIAFVDLNWTVVQRIIACKIDCDEVSFYEKVVKCGLF